MLKVADKRYMELVSRFPLRPIRSERDLDEATSIANGLAVQKRLTRSEQDYLDVLSDLIEKYEEEHHPIEPLSDGEALSALIESRGITQARLAREAGLSSSTISEVLNNRRELTRRHIEILSHYFDIDPAIFASPLRHDG